MRDSTRLAVTAAVSAIVTSIVLVASGMPGSSVTAGQPDDSSQQNSSACESPGSAAAYAVQDANAAACDTLHP